MTEPPLPRDPGGPLPDDQGDEPPIHDPVTDLDSPQAKTEARLRLALEWAAVAVGALAVALLMRGFLIQTFYIPSESMNPTLTEGNRVMVNKLSYEFGDPSRGDVVVFEKPPNATSTINDLIKRVVALPGETISFANGDVFIDGQLLDEDNYLDADVPTNSLGTIPFCDNEPSPDRCTVPEGRVFVMGDNRTGSTDSRRFGPVREDTIVGRAFVKVWPPGDIGLL